jgi:nucleotide-binding universal stress UspA family protein
MTVVVGYVPTPQGESAVAHAVTQAQSLRLRLVVVNSSRGDSAVDPGYAQDRDIARLREILNSRGMDGKYEFVQHVRGEDAAEEVLTAAQEYDAKLIVIGIRRRSPVSKFILGSTAQRILMEANCPVLAVKPLRQ